MEAIILKGKQYVLVMLLVLLLAGCGKIHESGEKVPNSGTEQETVVEDATTQIEKEQQEQNGSDNTSSEDQNDIRYIRVCQVNCVSLFILSYFSVLLCKLY